MDDAALIEIARRLTGEYAPSECCSAGGVAAALLTASGAVYTGVCVDTACSLGFCAEHAAVAEMLKARESHVRAIVAINEADVILPPCGRCRELLWQVDGRNRHARVLLGVDQAATLEELLPRPYRINRGDPA